MKNNDIISDECYGKCYQDSKKDRAEEIILLEKKILDDELYIAFLECDLKNGNSSNDKNIIKDILKKTRWKIIDSKIELKCLIYEYEKSYGTWSYDTKLNEKSDSKKLVKWNWKTPLKLKNK